MNLPGFLHGLAWKNASLSTFLACTLAAGLCHAAVTPPVPRIMRTFDIALRSHEPILETDSMIAAATSKPAVGATHEVWSKVVFWDSTGSGAPVERILNTTWDAREGSVAHDSRIFLRTSTGYLVVNRDPAIAPEHMNLSAIWKLAAINDRFLILASNYDDGPLEIQFRDTTSLEPIGSILTKIRPQYMATRDNEIAFAASDAKGVFRIYRMPYPDFTPGKKSAIKIKALTSKFAGVNHFGRNFAVMFDAKGQEHIIRWSDPSKGGQPGVYPVTQPPGYSAWIDCGGDLGRISKFPELALAHVTFANGSYTLEPAGVPGGFYNSRILSTGEGSVYLSAPVDNAFNPVIHPWCYRLDISRGREITVKPPVASERDGAMHFTLKLDSPAATAIQFSYETAGRSAQAGVDFTGVSGTGSIAAGETQAVIDVPLTEDQVIEGPESLELRITGVEGAFCDNQVTPGRIRGSGLRVLEEVTTDSSGVLATLDANVSKANAVRILQLPGGSVDARSHGFECFIPIAANSGTYFYARALLPGGEEMRLCQFDPATAQLLEVFDSGAPRKADGDQFIIQKGTGYTRYGFFDGMPVLNLDGIRVIEDGGPQAFLLRGERSSLPLEITGEWKTPAQGIGPFSFATLPSGDIRFEITPVDDRLLTFDRSLEILWTVSNTGSGTSTTSSVKLMVSDDDFVRTTSVAATGSAGAFVTDGDDLWMAGVSQPVIEHFHFGNGTLSAAGTLKAPKSTSLFWLRADGGQGVGGQSIAFDGNRLVAAGAKGAGGILNFSSLSSAKPKAKFVPTGYYSTSLQLTSGATIVGDGIPLDGHQGRVRILHPVTSKTVRELKPATPRAAFGQGLAISNGILWVSDPALSSGRVHGYSLTDYSLLRTLTSPEPIANGTFGYSIAASDEYLVVSEPSNGSNSSVWVYSPDGTTLLKRLDSGDSTDQSGFGSQVATRGGRVLVGCGTTPSLLVPSNEINFIGPVMGVQRPVYLWMDIDEDPVRLIPSAYGEVSYSSGGRVALMDDCAVFPGGAGLEFYVFPPAVESMRGEKMVKSATPGLPAWPSPGAPVPTWAFERSADGTADVSVSLGAVPEEPGKIVMEWSSDLKVWSPLADWEGDDKASAKVSAITPGADNLKISLESGDATQGFFRLRTVED